MAARTSTSIDGTLARAAERFARAGCESPRLDAEILLAEALRCNRAHLLAHGGDPIPDAAQEQFAVWASRREKREPVAYITGRREFFGLDFAVTPAVLIPRPETEHLVEEAIVIARRVPLRGAARRSNPALDEGWIRCARNDGEGVFIADVGTGSGAIAVSLAVHLPGAHICALDASADALAVAWRNSDHHGVTDRMCLVQSDLLENLPWPADILAANLPYISDAEWDALAPEIRLHEPAMALRGGADGLNCIRRLLEQAPGHLQPGGTVLLEIGMAQAASVRSLALASFPSADVRIVQDYAGLDRVIVVQTA